MLLFSIATTDMSIMEEDRVRTLNSIGSVLKALKNKLTSNGEIHNFTSTFTLFLRNWQHQSEIILGRHIVVTIDPNNVNDMLSKRFLGFLI